MLKSVYIEDVLDNTSPDLQVTLLCWVKSRRCHGGIIFVELVDSTGTLQAIVRRDNICNDDFNAILHVPVESAVEIEGAIVNTRGKREIDVLRCRIISISTLSLHPQPRVGFNIYDDARADHIAKNKAVYLREPHYMAILRFRSKVMRLVREWFEEKHFMEFDAPILVRAPLYDDSTAMAIDIKGQDAFLSQCAGFYLEAAAMAFERVYNMGPSFRGEESRSKRHLKEYWHIKAELAFGGREDIIGLVEELLVYLYTHIPSICRKELDFLEVGLRDEEFKTPYPRITYEDAVAYVQSKGSDTTLGLGVSSKDEAELSKLYTSPFWIIGIPRTIEPFPYVIDEDNPTVTKVADLIAPRGYGELCGVAEKIFTSRMLQERMGEKNKLHDDRYNFVKDVHNAGCVPHIAFGMGFERLLRWLLDIPHVRDTIPFPRAAGRRIDH